MPLATLVAERKNLENNMENLHLPLRNLEYTLHEYLNNNGLRIDVETRYLLAKVRDCLGHLAHQTHGGRGNGAIHAHDPGAEDGWFQGIDRTV